MTTEQQAQQLRLAADILETGHPWEYQPDNYSWHVSQGNCPIFATQKKWPIRLILATPPDNRPLHNPDNLTAEQVGAGYRLLLEEESTNQPHEVWKNNSKQWDSALIGTFKAKKFRSTYRVPLSTPWPDPKPDPHAALKQAHKEGKAVQSFNHERDIWQDCASPAFEGGTEYRIKPEPTFQLPPPPPGMQWHREDGWTGNMLTQGYRPLVRGEKVEKADEVSNIPSAPFITACDSLGKEAGEAYPDQLCRTRRPLTFTHLGKTWTYHRPGDPMPCDGEAWVECLCDNGGTLDVTRAKVWRWNGTIIGWRYVDEKKTVPLGPENVKPFTVIRRKGETETWHWRTVSYVDAVKVNCGNRGYGWAELASDYERNESLPLTGKWNPSSWEPCHKTI